VKTFLILSYPRSRTLWLSRFLSIPPIAFCGHDWSEFAASAAEYWGSLEAEIGYAAGAADTAAIMVLPALLAVRPLTRVVWIERPLAEVATSMDRVGLSFTPAGAGLLRAHKERYQEFFDLEIPFKALNEVEVMETLWRLVLPDLAFPTAKWNELANKRIAYTARDFAARPRSTEKFLRFLANEGEVKLCSS